MTTTAQWQDSQEPCILYDCPMIHSQYTHLSFLSFLSFPIIIRVNNL